MGVKIYIWSKEGMMERWGHTAMSLSDGTHISWWPAGHDKTSIKANPVMTPAAENHTLQDDVKLESKSADLVIDITGKLDESAIKSWWLEYKSGAEKWNAIGNNCSSVVYKALKVGGALDYFTTKERHFWESTLVPSTPKHVDNFAGLLRKKNNQKVSTGEELLHGDTNSYAGETA